MVIEYTNFLICETNNYFKTLIKRPKVHKIRFNNYFFLTENELGIFNSSIST